MSKHARLGPSNARWPHCPGSVREEANYEDVPGSAAIDGTGSHCLLELCLKTNHDASYYDGQIIEINHPDNLGGWLVDLERCKRVQQCLDYVSARRGELEAQGYQVEVLSESKSSPGELFGRSDWWGTVDISISARTNGVLVVLEVVDFKDGRGYVSVKNNTQLASYALGRTLAYPTNDNTAVQLTIVQPKTAPVVRSVTMTMGGLMAKGRELSIAADATDATDAPLIPDNKGGKGYCQWCKHKVNCEARNNNDMSELSAIEALPPAASLKGIADKALAGIVSSEPAVMAMIEKAKAEIQRRIESGAPVAGYAMVPGRAARVWNENEETMVKLFRARKLKQGDYYTQKIITPAQAEKLDTLTDEQKQKLIGKYVTEKAGKMKLTKVAYEKPTVNEMFPVTEELIPAGKQTVVQDHTDTAQCETDTVSFL